MSEKELASKMDAALAHVDPNRRKFLGILLAGVAAAPLLNSASLAAEDKPGTQKTEVFPKNATSVKGNTALKNNSAIKNDATIKNNNSAIKNTNPGAIKNTNSSIKLTNAGEHKNSSANPAWIKNQTSPIKGETTAIKGETKPVPK
jgi:hypothetical protein